MDLDQYLTSDATTLAGLVAAKEVTASELLALARQRSDAVNPTINAVVMPLTRVADARAADQRLPGAVPRRRHGALPRHPTLPRGGPGGLRQDQHPGVRGQGQHRAHPVGA